MFIVVSLVVGADEFYGGDPVSVHALQLAGSTTCAQSLVYRVTWGALRPAVERDRLVMMMNKTKRLRVV